MQQCVSGEYMGNYQKNMAWRDYQDKAAELFCEMGFDTDVEEVLVGARGKHEIDVVARNTLGGLAVTWIVECKYWKSAVPKAHVLTLAQIAQDVGADRAVLLSETGFQAGAISVSRKSNVLLTSLEELRSAAAHSIAELSIKRSLLMVKKLERELQEILFDYGPRTPPPPELDKTITLLGACLEVTLTILAAQTGRFPVRLPSMLSGELPLADELPTVADALDSAVEEIADRCAILKSEVAEALESYVLSSRELIRLVRHLMAAGSELLSPSADAEGERKLQKVVAAMRAVGDCAETPRSAPSTCLSEAVHSLMRQLIDGPYLWFADPNRTSETWDELTKQIDQAIADLTDATENTRS